MNKILADKYTEMFRQSFGNVIHEENIIINGKNCVIYRFSPVTPEFNMIGGFSHFIEVADTLNITSNTLKKLKEILG